MFKNVSAKNAVMAIQKRFSILSKHPSKSELKVLGQHLDWAAIEWEKEIYKKLKALGPTLSLEFIDVYPPNKLKVLAKQLELQRLLYEIKFNVKLYEFRLQILNRGE